MSSTDVVLENFADPVHEWFSMNDPVMGGESYSDFSVENGLGVFAGEVKDVPFLHAPGFITLRGQGKFPDASSCEALQITARATTSYSGYRVSFGDRHVEGNHYAYGYKSDFDLPMSTQMSKIVIPFDEFTVRWNDATGDAIVTCAENKDFCPDVHTLRDMKVVTIWGEGVDGEINLEVESIQATSCSEDLRVSRVRSSPQFAHEEQARSFSSSSFVAGLATGVAITAMISFVGVFLHKKRRSKANEGPEQPATAPIV